MSLLFKKLHPGFLPQAQVLGHSVDVRHTCADTGFIEKVVAGHSQRLFHIDDAVGLLIVGVDEALGRIALVFIFGVHTLVLNGGGRGDLPIVDGGNGHRHFKHGARRIGGLKSPVVQGIPFRLQQLVKILGVGGGIVGGVAGAGQNLAGFHVYGHHCAALGVLPLVLLPQALLPQLQNHLLQGSLGGNLHVEVNGGLHIGAGFGLGLEVLRNHVALGIYGGELHPVGAVEVLLEGSLEAALAHIGVHGVALILVFRPL